MDPTVERWRKAGRYLPKFMRDFHDQKDLFKAMHEMVAVHNHEYCKDISWAAGHCYIIDIFLWHMARHGYTLQHAPQKLPFEDLYDNTKATNDAAKAQVAKVLFAAPPPRPDRGSVMTERLTAAEIIHVAITWAEESMVQMVDGCQDDDPYRAEVADQLKQLRAYRKRRFGKPTDPLDGARLVGLEELRQLVPPRS